ncbi:MAG: pilus assembly protein PilM [Deltaproteobacteria bacterium]|nr:pilus assembly protein PilM [Deltaproteobacteria bacterium]
MFKKKGKGSKEVASQETRVAIDIGLSSIKFAYFKDDLLCLEEYPLFDQPRDLSELKRKVLVETYRTTIAKALRMLDPNVEFIVSPQPSLKVLTRLLYHPSDSNLSSYLEKELPFEEENFGFDFQRIEGPSSGNKKSKKNEKKSPKILVAACDLDFIQQSIGLLGAFQLRVKKFTPNPVALLNYLMLTSNGDGLQPVVLLDLGALYSSLIIYRGRGQVLTRTLNLGGNHFNQQLVKKLNVDFETAEKIKTERKLIDDGLFDSKKSSTSMPMFQAINPLLYALVDEIKNTMTYFEDFFLEDISDASIWLAGGTAKLQNLDRFLAKEISLPAQRVEDAVHNLIPEQSFSSQFASSVGLLGSPSNPDLLDINLLKNVDGLLIKMEEGEYYLTQEGFVNKKKYKKKQKARPSKTSFAPRAAGAVEEEPSLLPIAFIRELPARIGALFKGEKFEMPEMHFSFGGGGLGNIKSHLKIFFIIAGVLFLCGYGINEFYWASKKKAVTRTINDYLGKRQAVDRMRASLPQVGGVEIAEAKVETEVTRTDKIIWAQKMKAIADAIPERVWLSDLKVQSNPLALVLSCHVYSYGEDHLKDIARFIKNLEKQKVFLKDFTEITFHAATRSTKDKDVYNFTLTFPLKRNMILKTKETVVKAKG